MATSDAIKEFNKEFARQVKFSSASMQRDCPAMNLPAFNPSSGQPYHGLNQLMLDATMRKDPRWVTLKQANAMHYSVKKGEKGQKIAVWRTPQEGEPQDRAQLQYATVFNFEQLQTAGDGRAVASGTGVSPIFETRQYDDRFKLAHKPLDYVRDDIEAIISNSDAAIYQDVKPGQAEHYDAKTDAIHLKPEGQYGDKAHYYSAALEGLVRSMAHNDRFGDYVGVPGTVAYAREEIKVKMATWMMAREVGLPYTPGNQEGFKDDWAKLIEANPYELTKIATEAEKAKTAVLGMGMKPDMASVKRAESQKAKEAGMTREEQDSQRVYFKISKEEKDKAKPLGVHWNPANQRWYSPSDNPKLPQLKEKYEVLTPEQVKESYQAAQEEMRRRTYFDISPAEKDEAKGKGAKWDNLKVAWYGDTPEVIAALKERWPVLTQEQQEANAKRVIDEYKKRDYIKVPKEDWAKAKANGAKWDYAKRAAYAPEGPDKEKLIAMWPVATLEEIYADRKERRLKEQPQVSPEEEFKAALESAGLVIEGLPIMDGEIHRVMVEGGKPHSKDGAYKAYSDGRPNGWYENHKTGVKEKWVATGHHLTEEQLQTLKTEAKAKAEQRQQEQKAKQAKAIEAAVEKLAAAVAASPDHPYFAQKGIQPVARVAQDKNGNLLVPLFDLSKSVTAPPLQSIQTITPGGAKIYEKDCPKTGGTFILDTAQALQQKDPSQRAQTILVAEGLATGASLHEATGLPVAVAFDAYNLSAVGERLRGAYPDIPLTFCADNDYGQTNNPGVRYAQSAAELTGGKVIIPTFNDEDKKKWKGQKGPSDFNDMAALRGLFWVKSTVFAALAAQRHMERVEALSEDKGVSLGLSR